MFRARLQDEMWIDFPLRASSREINSDSLSVARCTSALISSKDSMASKRTKSGFKDEDCTSSRVKAESSLRPWPGIALT